MINFLGIVGLILGGIFLFVPLVRASDIFLDQYGSIPPPDEPSLIQVGSFPEGDVDLTQIGSTPPQEIKDTPYPQCGGTVGLQSEDPTFTFLVTRVRDAAGNIIRYEKESLGNLNQCQQPPPPERVIVQPPPPVIVQPAPQPVSQSTSVPNTNRNTNTFSGDIDNNIGNDVNARNTNTNTNVASNNLENDVRVSQSQSQNNIASSRSSTGSVSINVAGGGTAPAASPQVVTVPVRTVAPVAVKSPTAVAGEELPRTGPPLLAALLAGLLPVGWRLRRFGGGESSDGSVGRFLWQKREFERES